MHKDFSDDDWEDYTYWVIHDKKILKNLSGYWSRAIDEKHRLVYKIEDEIIKIIQCKNHYNDK